LTRQQVVEAARARADALGMGAGARVLTTRAWSSVDDWLDTFFAPLVAGGSLVLVANCADEAVLERRMQQERATVRV
jgi:hypothetical protein